MQAKMRANFSFFNQAPGQFAVEMIGIVQANASSGVMLIHGPLGVNADKSTPNNFDLVLW